METPKQLDLTDGLDMQELNKNAEQLKALTAEKIVNNPNFDRIRDAINQQWEKFAAKIPKGENLARYLAGDKQMCAVFQIRAKFEGKYTGPIDGQFTEQLRLIALKDEMFAHMDMMYKIADDEIFSGITGYFALDAMSQGIQEAKKNINEQPDIHTALKQAQNMLDEFEKKVDDNFDKKDEEYPKIKKLLAQSRNALTSMQFEYGTALAQN